MNIEGESLRKMAGSTKSGGLSAVTGWLAARGKSKEGSGSSVKSGEQFHNETLAKMYEHAMSQKSKQGDLTRTLRLARSNKKEGLGVKGHASADHKVELYQQPSSSGGQGTSGNVKGTQFTGKNTTSKPRTTGRAPANGGTTPAKPSGTSSRSTGKSTGSGHMSF